MVETRDLKHSMLPALRQESGLSRHHSSSAIGCGITPHPISRSPCASVHARHWKSGQSTLSVRQWPFRRASCGPHQCQSPERDRSLSWIKTACRGSGHSRRAPVSFLHRAKEEFNFTSSELHSASLASTPDPYLRVELREEQRRHCHTGSKTGRPRKSSQINSLFESKSTHICPLFLTCSALSSILALFWASPGIKHFL